jgi:hypothetical protein
MAQSLIAFEIALCGALQELLDVTRESGVVLKQETMPRARIDDRPRIGGPLRCGVAVVGTDHHLMRSAGVEDWQGELSEVRTDRVVLVAASTTTRAFRQKSN